MEWSQTYPGLPAMVSAARAFVRSMLADSPRIDDAESVTSELMSNSLHHTPSGHGGEVEVTVTTQPGWARVAISDSGTGAWTPSSAGEWDEYGRGLLIVEALADKFGHDASASGQTTWAEFTWSADA